MSRVGKMPVKIPAGVTVTTEGGRVVVTGAKATLTLPMSPSIALVIENGEACVSQESLAADKMHAGTMRSLLNNAVEGVTKGYERKLTLVGVGYRAQTQGQKLNLALGFSHPIEYPIPAGITVETPTQTEVIVKGADKKMVGQVASDIRRFRPPEPYKGKGVRYSTEKVLLKEAKKK